MRRAAAQLCAGIILLSACSLQPSARPSLEGPLVDEGTPDFSRPTTIDNPLFPVATLRQVVLLGVDSGQPMRVEVTLMPETRTIAWEGRSVDTVVVQFIAYSDRRVVEVAYDYFAQADDGSVWYFGESVDNYSGGRVSNHSGAWLAGLDGPPGMIMPASPATGDRYRPENIPGLVLEEVTVLETGLTVDGPSGQVGGAIRVEEHLMDGSVEQKLWAPGYGEFHTETTGELLTVAIAAPTDALGSEVPAALRELRRLATAAADDGLGDSLDEMQAAWGRLRDQAPPLLAEAMAAAMTALTTASGARDERSVRQAAVDLLRTCLDLELRHRSPASVDLDRLGAWMRQLLLDLDAPDLAGAIADGAIARTIAARLEQGHGERVSAQLGAVEAAVDAGDRDAARAAAAELLGTID